MKITNTDSRRAGDGYVLVKGSISILYLLTEIGK